MPDQVWETGNTKSTENTEGKRGAGDRKQGSTRGIPKLEFNYPQ